MQTPEESRRAEELFELALELPAAEREAFLDAQCGTDPGMAKEVRLLLTHYEAAPPDFLHHLLDPADRTGGDRRGHGTIQIISRPKSVETIIAPGQHAAVRDAGRADWHGPVD